MEDATGQAKCGVRRSADKPLVVEWPGADRAALESRARGGLVAVRYEGCEMEVLTNCNAAGEYAYVGLTQKREGVKITSADELYAQLPVGAAGLEAKLERAGQLNVDMVIVGRKEATKTVFNERDLDGRCDEATHVITGLTVGAFSFYTGASAAVGGAVKVGNMGVGAGSSHGEEVLKQDGNGEACSVASSADESPPEGCGALLRVEVVPIDRIFEPPPNSGTSTAAASSPNAPADTGPAPDPMLDKKIKTNRVMLITGYGAFLVGAGLAAGGYVLWTRSKTSLMNEPEGAVSPDRPDNKSKFQAGVGLAWGGMAVAVGGLVLALYASARAKQLSRQKALRARVGPAVGPGMTGLSLSGRF